MNAGRGFDPTVAHPARRYDYWLGGKDNFAADRDSADIVEVAFPTVRAAARQNRAFLGRVVAALTAQEQIGQILDVGAGLPAAANTHQIAQHFNPAATVVYADNDPVVLAHGQALLTASPGAAATTIVPADLRDPAGLLADPVLRAVLDLDKPVGLLLIAVLHFLDDTDHPHDVVEHLVDALAPGSWLAVSHVSGDLLDPSLAENAAAVNEEAGIAMTLRSREQITRFFDGLDLTEPGVVPIHRWRPADPARLPADIDIGLYGGVARKPEARRPRPWTPRQDRRTP